MPSTSTVALIVFPFAALLSIMIESVPWPLTIIPSFTVHLNDKPWVEPPVLTLRKN